MEINFQSKSCIIFKSQKVVIQKLVVQCLIILLPDVITTQMNYNKTDCTYGKTSHHNTRAQLLEQPFSQNKRETETPVPKIYFFPQNFSLALTYS